MRIGYQILWNIEEWSENIISEMKNGTSSKIKTYMWLTL